MSKKTNHTKGPWDVVSLNNLPTVKVGTGESEASPAEFWHPNEECLDGREVNEADAYLMAAAPEMLEALEIAHKSLKIQLATRGGPQHMSHAHIQVLNAINKARGGA